MALAALFKGVVAALAGAVYNSALAAAAINRLLDPIRSCCLTLLATRSLGAAFIGALTGFPVCAISLARCLRSLCISAVVM
jgi:hypothetical protein